MVDVARSSRVAVGSDHAGFVLKGFLASQLAAMGLSVIDLGTTSEEPTDYPRYCFAVAEAVADGKADWGIVLGGSGQGEQMAANKVHGIRAALCNDTHFAKLARRDNDANVLAIGARIVAREHALEIVTVWIETSFAGDRHLRRIRQIDDYRRGTSVG